MKRLALLTLFFFACSFSYPMQARANAAVILVGAAAIGAAMVATSAGTYYAQTGQVPSYIKTAANAVGTATDEVFQPSYLAKGVGLLFTPQSLNTAKEYYAAKVAAVGAKVGDIVDHVKNSTSSAYDSLKNLISSYTTPGGVPSTSFSSGAIFTLPDGRNVKISNNPWQYNGEATGPQFWLNYNYQTYQLSDSLLLYLVSGTAVSFIRLGPGGPTAGRYYYYGNSGTVVSDAATVSPNPDAIDYPGLAGALANPSADVSNQLRGAIADLPDTKKKVVDSMPATTGQATTAPTLTAAEIAQLLAQNAAAVAQATAQTAKDLAAANPDDIAAQIAANQAAANAAKAAADAAQQASDAAKEETPDETFSAISDTPFAEAYNPGEFDIPERFTTFLCNVKSSGLFSFSSSFFNSLPGGGSPIFTINGGETFGTHTIDFSETFTNGLAAIKAVMLALFGFLSIRAIIMKR